MKTDEPSPFEQLRQAAAAQSEPQRLLFVFANAVPAEAATPEQRRHFRGGGALVPSMCVDKGLDELTTFDALAAESREAGPPWQVMFAAGVSGHDGQPPTAEQVDQALQLLVDRVLSGRLEGLIPFDPTGRTPAIA
jgi:hypothetical protein